MLAAVLVPMAVAVAVVLPMIGAKRLAYWLSWLPGRGLLIIGVDVVLCGGAGILAAYISVKSGWQPQGTSAVTYGVPSVLTNLALRKNGGAKPAKRGDGLLCGLVEFWHTWTDGTADAAVRYWTTRLDDDTLLDHCTELDVHDGTSSSVKERERRRRELEIDLKGSDDAKVRNARWALRNALHEAIVRRQVRRPQ